MAAHGHSKNRCWLGHLVSDLKTSLQMGTELTAYAEECITGKLHKLLENKKCGDAEINLGSWKLLQQAEKLFCCQWQSRMPEIKSIFHGLLVRDFETNVWPVFKLCANQKDYYSEIHMIKCSIHVIKYFKSFLRGLNLLADAAWDSYGCRKKGTNLVVWVLTAA